jgi:hypothetical protein
VILGVLTLGLQGLTDSASGGTTVLAADVTLSGDQSWRTNNYTRFTVTNGYASKLHLGGRSLSVTTAAPGSRFEVGETATVDGAGTLTFGGVATASLYGAMDVSGPMNISSGFVNLQPKGTNVARLAGGLNLNDGNLFLSGTVDLTGSAMTVGSGGTSSPIVTMSGGRLMAGSLVAGQGGFATMYHDDGTVSVSGAVTIGRNAGANGEYDLGGGLLSAASLAVGSGGGVGALYQTGGTLSVSSAISVGTGSLLSVAVPASSSSYTRAGTWPAVTVGVSGAATGSASLNVAKTVRTGASATRATVAVMNSLLLPPGSTSGTYAGAVDLGNNDLIVRGGAANLETLRSYLSAYKLSGSTKNGLGASAASSANFTTLALFPNATDAGTTYFTQYDGVTGLTASDVIVKFTYIGDTNLDGVLDGKDYKNVMEGFVFGLSGWARGDVDNSGGAVSAADVSAFISAYNWFQGQTTKVSYGSGQEAAEAVGVVPEPGTAFVTIAGVLIAGRRRRE